MELKVVQSPAFSYIEHLVCAISDCLQGKQILYVRIHDCRISKGITDNDDFAWYRVQVCLSSTMFCPAVTLSAHSSEDHVHNSTSHQGLSWMRELYFLQFS